MFEELQGNDDRSTSPWHSSLFNFICTDQIRRNCTSGLTEWLFDYSHYRTAALGQCQELFSFAVSLKMREALIRHQRVELTVKKRFRKLKCLNIWAKFALHWWSNWFSNHIRVTASNGESRIQAMKCREKLSDWLTWNLLKKLQKQINSEKPSQCRLWRFSCLLWASSYESLFNVYRETCVKSSETISLSHTRFLRNIPKRILFLSYLANTCSVLNQVHVSHKHEFQREVTITLKRLEPYRETGELFFRLCRIIVCKHSFVSLTVQSLGTDELIDYIIVIFDITLGRRRSEIGRSSEAHESVLVLSGRLPLCWTLQASCSIAIEVLEAQIWGKKAKRNFGKIWFETENRLTLSSHSKMIFFHWKSVGRVQVSHFTQKQFDCLVREIMTPGPRWYLSRNLVELIKSWDFYNVKSQCRQSADYTVQNLYSALMSSQQQTRWIGKKHLLKACSARTSEAV